MSESLEYIERYFEEEMNPDEKKEFEDRCIQDLAFARDVAVYVMMQDQMARKWKEEKKKEFNSFAAESSESRIVAEPGTKATQGKLRALNPWKYVAIAASAVLVIGVGVVF